jgi:hypothetical protein
VSSNGGGLKQVVLTRDVPREIKAIDIAKEGNDTDLRSNLAKHPPALP